VALASQPTLVAGRYRVAGRLGAGGMAVVLLAEDERLGRKVAIKRLRAESPDDAAQRFQREAKLGASLNHPNLVGVYDIVTDDEGVLIVMEYVDGQTLRLELDSSGPMRPARAIEVLSGMAAGLDHAHAQGVVHRDVKPANVLIAARDGAVKITDLGIATAAERTNITNSGVVLGTAAYLAPERLDGHAGGPAADVYATAAVAFEMLSGRKAVTGRTAVEIARRVVEAPPPDLAAIVPGTPPAAADALKRGMAKDPAERHGSVGELVRELSEAYAETVSPAPPPTVRPALTPATRPRRGWLVPAVLALLAAAVLAIVLLAGSGSEHPTAKQPAPAKSGHAQARAHRRQPPARTGASPAPPSPAPAPPPASAPSPAAALTSFYTRAASHDFAGAWARGTGNLHAQFGGSLDTFRNTLATLQSIEFPALSVTSETGATATVAFSSVAHHTDRTDRCTGTATMVRASQQWLVDHIAVNCATDGSPQKPQKPQKPKKPKQLKHSKSPKR
jgi:serine/threonine protein kinase